MMVPTLINGTWEVLLPAHRAARTEWRWWERARLASMYRNLRRGDVLIDVGAEEGDMSSLFARWIDPGGVVLIEPNPKVWPNIRAIWEANALPKPRAWFVGFAGHETNLSPPHSDVDSHDRHGWPACAYGDVIGDHGFRGYRDERGRTPTVRLDDLAATSDITPDAITMDVEGAEWAVLEGAEHLLREVRPMVWISIHPSFLRDTYGLNRCDVLRFMEERGYEGYPIATDHEEHWAFSHPDGRRIEQAG